MFPVIYDVILILIGSVILFFMLNSFKSKFFSSAYSKLFLKSVTSATSLNEKNDSKVQFVNNAEIKIFSPRDIDNVFNC